MIHNHINTNKNESISVFANDNTADEINQLENEISAFPNKKLKIVNNENIVNTKKNVRCLLKCEQCGSLFLSEQGLNDHLIVHNNIQAKKQISIQKNTKILIQDDLNKITPTNIKNNEPKVSTKCINLTSKESNVNEKETNASLVDESTIKESQGN